MAAIAVVIGGAKPKGGSASDAAVVEVPRLGHLAEELWSRAEKIPQLIWTDADQEPSPKGDSPLESLARYLWALSVERGCRAKFLCAIGSMDAREMAETFVHTIGLSPVSVDGVRRLIEGVLGQVKVESSTLERIHAITGGTPGLIHGVVAELRERGNLTRSAGAWALREEERLDSLRLDSVSNLLGHAWSRLGSELQVVLLRCALLGRGLVEVTFATSGSDSLLGDQLAVLESRGWVRSREGRWQVASEAVRSVALERSAPGLLREISADCLSRLGTSLDPEERGELALRAEETERSLELGMEAARLALRRADHHAAARRLHRLVDIAVRLGMFHRAREASMMLGEALHSLGRGAEALEVLTNSSVWAAAVDQDPLTGERDLLLGKSYRTLGETDRARAHQRRAIDLAHGRGDRSLWLRSHAELAQIDWELGTAEDRAAAIAEPVNEFETLGS